MKRDTRIAGRLYKSKETVRQNLALCGRRDKHVSHIKYVYYGVHARECNCIVLEIKGELKGWQMAGVARTKTLTVICVKFIAKKIL